MQPQHYVVSQWYVGVLNVRAAVTVNVMHEVREWVQHLTSHRTGHFWDEFFQRFCQACDYYCLLFGWCDSGPCYSRSMRHSWLYTAFFPLPHSHSLSECLPELRKSTLPVVYYCLLCSVACDHLQQLLRAEFNGKTVHCEAICSCQICSCQILDWRTYWASVILQRDTVLSMLTC